jgi:hypothetical protein
MKKFYFINIISAFLFLTIAAPLSAMNYQHNLDTGKIQFSWTIQEDRIFVLLTANTTGWVGIGFSPEKAMTGANIIIGAVEKGKLSVEDHYATRKNGHTNDEKLGGVNNILDPFGSEENGITSISFSLQLQSDDKYDKSINPYGITKVMLAFGEGKDSFKTYHPFRFIYEINLSTGENKKIK